MAQYALLIAVDCARSPSTISREVERAMVGRIAIGLRGPIRPPEIERAAQARPESVSAAEGPRGQVGSFRCRNAATAAPQGLHAGRGEANPDRYLGHPQRSHIGRDEGGETLAGVALRVQRCPSSQVCTPTTFSPPRRRLVHGDQAVAGEDGAMAHRPDPLARDRAGLPGPRRATP